MIDILKAYKYRLYPNQKQELMINKTFGCVRFVYNKMLAERKEVYEQYKDNKEELKKQKLPTPAKYKTEFEWLKEVDSLALANAQMNLQTAYSNFFRDKSVGFPKFKSRKINYRSYKTNNQNGTISIIGDNKVKLPKIGSIKVNLHRKFTGLIKSATISKTPTGKYYISILVEEEIKQLKPVDSKVGVDVGIKDFAVLSNGGRYENPKWLRKSEKKLKKTTKRFIS